MARDNGIGTEYHVSYSVSLTLISFLSIALYNVIELTLVIFTTFKRRHGFYFWSVLVATLGIVPYSLGLLLKFYHLTTAWPLYTTLIAVGWPCMITGQSLVMYSRLHLLSHSAVHGWRWVLWMIITNAIVCHIPVAILLYGSNSSSSADFINAYSIYEKIQISLFFIQEVTISGIYIWKTRGLLRSEGHIRGRNSRRVMSHLIWVNLIIILLDVTLLSIEYAGFYDIQTCYKAAVYSIKLKMEFSILNRLLDLFQGRIDDSYSDGQSHSYRPDIGWAAARRSTRRPTRAADGSGARASYPGTPTLGNSAYARMDDENNREIDLADMKIVKTTEVRMETSTRRPSDEERDSMSIDESSIRGIGGVGTLGSDRRDSGSTSEIQIVRA